MLKSCNMSQVWKQIKLGFKEWNAFLAMLKRQIISGGKFLCLIVQIDY